MNTRSSRSMVTFSNAFAQPGYPDQLPAGTYEVIVEEELLLGLSFEAWRRVSTFLVSEATRDLPTREDTVETPLESTKIRRLDRRVVAVPILRAGIGMLQAFVDLVSTGNTLRANDLVAVEDIMPISSRLIVNQAALKTRGARLQPLLDAFARSSKAGE